MKRLILSTSLIIVSFMAAQSQIVKKELEAVKKDPKTSERAAKADVYTAKDKRICDSSTIRKSDHQKPVARRNKKTIN